MHFVLLLLIGALSFQRCSQPWNMLGQFFCTSAHSFQRCFEPWNMFGQFFCMSLPSDRRLRVPLLQDWGGLRFVSGPCFSLPLPGRDETSVEITTPQQSAEVFRGQGWFSECGT